MGELGDFNSERRIAMKRGIRLITAALYTFSGIHSRE